MSVVNIKVGFLPGLEQRHGSQGYSGRIFNPNDHWIRKGGTHCFRIDLRPPARRATVNRDVKLLVYVEWDLRNGRKAEDYRLVRLIDVAEPFWVDYNRSNLEVRFCPEDLAPLLVAIDDAMERVG